MPMSSVSEYPMSSDELIVGANDAPVEVESHHGHGAIHSLGLCAMVKAGLS